jgi:Domain of unknown function DUF29
MGTTYEKDVIAWSIEQAHALRSGDFSKLDIEHLADEIEDVGKSEQRELANRMAVLLAHLLKWQCQPDKRAKSWTDTIALQRERIARRVKRTPSFKASFRDPDWWADAWDDATTQCAQETGIDITSLPTACPWSAADVMADKWLPE